MSQNKSILESSVNVGKILLEFILKNQHKSDPEFSNFKDKLKRNNTMKNKFHKEETALLENGANIDNLDKLDLSMLHKLISHLCGIEAKDPELEKNLRTLKGKRNQLAHSNDINTYTEIDIWKRIEELRSLYENILIKIKDFYQTEIEEKRKEINNALDSILRHVEVKLDDDEVLDVVENINRKIGKCPLKVKIDVKNDVRKVYGLNSMLERLSKENTTLKLQFYWSFFGGLRDFYDSEDYLSILLDKDSKCKLSVYRGTLSTRLLQMLPESLTQLYIRVYPDQLEYLNAQLAKLPDLWSLTVYLFLTEKDDQYHSKTIKTDPSSLPLLKYKGKQLGIKVRAPITVDDIPWIVSVIKRLTQEHQCDTLEIYGTRLDYVKHVSDLIVALHEADIHVTTWLKLQNRMDWNNEYQEKEIAELAVKLNFKKFKFLWS